MVVRLGVLFFFLGRCFGMSCLDIREPGLELSASQAMVLGC